MALRSEDISLGRDVEDISHDLIMLKQGAKDVGLQLNPNKCEIISVVPDSQNSILSTPWFKDCKPIYGHSTGFTIRWCVWYFISKLIF